MASVTVDNERETPRGWSYRVLINRGSTSTEHVVTLSWADYEHWTSGATPPSRVVEAIANILVPHEGQENIPNPLPARFDASTARRWRPRIDHELGAAL